jgi:GNAT superfamily N-acetyltransferase
MIRKCRSEDIEEMYVVINEAARAYKGVIPPDRYHEPYMPMHELREEMQRMTFFGWEEKQRLFAVIGFQPFEDVTLIRHAYVLPDYQRRGLGGKLLEHLKALTTTPCLLVGTWADASWAIEFYEKHGFCLLANKEELLRTYWDIPERQIETSVVLGMTLGGGSDRVALSFSASYAKITREDH